MSTTEHESGAEYVSNGAATVSREALDIAYQDSRHEERIPTTEMDTDPLEFKSDYVGHLVSPEGPNYDVEEGYRDLDTVDRLLLEGVNLEGSDNKVRQTVIETRNELLEQGQKEHADQLDSVLIGKTGGAKLNCKEVEGGQGLHPGDANYEQNHNYGGPKNNVRDRDYSDHNFGLQSDLEDEQNQALENLSKAAELLG